MGFSGWGLRQIVYKCLEAVTPSPTSRSPSFFHSNSDSSSFYLAEDLRIILRKIWNRKSKFLAEDADTESKGIKWNPRHSAWTIRPPDSLSILGSKIFAARWVSLRKKEIALCNWESANWRDGSVWSEQSHGTQHTDRPLAWGVSCSAIAVLKFLINLNSCSVSEVYGTRTHAPWAWKQVWT